LRPLLFLSLACCLPAGDAVAAEVLPPQNDANTANNPLSIVPALQVQNYVQPVLRDESGSGANQPILRGILPFHAFGGSNLLRVSLPVATSVWGEHGAATGIGDLTLFSVRVFPISSHSGIGVGPLLVAPTASSDLLGSGSWQFGAQTTYSSHYSWGLVAALVSYQQSWDGSTNAVTAQPFVFRNIGNGFYLRSSAIISFDVRSGEGVLPIGLGLGKVTRLASGNLLNLYLEPQVSVIASGAGQPRFQVFAGFNLQFPPKQRAAASTPLPLQPRP
jgi:hypothetical protein